MTFDALGLTKHMTEKDARKHYALNDRISLIRNSDAHLLNQIGQSHSSFFIEKPGFAEVKKALNQTENRYVKINEDHF